MEKPGELTAVHRAISAKQICAKLLPTNHRMVSLFVSLGFPWVGLDQGAFHLAKGNPKTEPGGSRHFAVAWCDWKLETTHDYLLGLRPLTGYASLKGALRLYDMSCYVMRVAHSSHKPIPDDAGNASFLGPSRAPTQLGHMGPRAQQAAQKDQLASQPGNANASKRRK